MGKDGTITVEEAKSIEVTFESVEEDHEAVITLTREWAGGLAIAIGLGMQSDDNAVLVSSGSEQLSGNITATGGTATITGGTDLTANADAYVEFDGAVTIGNAASVTLTAQGGTATVTDDVDVYSKPGGDDRFNMGFLTKGTQVNLVKGGGCPQNDWCHVTGSNVPNGDGYAWGSFFSTP